MADRQDADEDGGDDDAEQAPIQFTTSADGPWADAGDGDDDAAGEDDVVVDFGEQEVEDEAEQEEEEEDDDDDEEVEDEESEDGVTALRANCKARLCGLIGHTEYNGELVTCRHWLPVSCVWAVISDTGDFQTVSASNLELVEDDEEEGVDDGDAEGEDEGRVREGGGGACDECIPSCLGHATSASQGSPPGSLVCLRCRAVVSHYACTVLSLCEGCEGWYE